MTVIKLVAYAKFFDLQETYKELFKTLNEINDRKADYGPNFRLDRVKEAVELLLPEASEELKEQTRLSFIKFAQDFAEQTGLNME